jgi:tRNA (guanine37-N1)-methyltransferase
MNITVFTLFPKMISDFCNESLLGKALEKNIWRLNIVDIRDYSKGKYKKVDDKVYGGGAGLVMRADVLGEAIEKNCDKDTKIIYLTPRGRHIDQKTIRNLHDSNKNLALICGRYEGIDERILEEYNIEELSIGDFVVMGGELPALLLLEGLVRCVGGVVGDAKSIEEDSFGGGFDNKFSYLLEYPLYTKPRIWKNREVPSVLISGNHKEIENWKIEQAELITKTRRVDLWERYREEKNSCKHE